MKKILLTLLLAVLFMPAVFAATTYAQAEPKIVITEEPIVYLFGREDCGFCKAQLEWLETTDIKYEYLDILQDDKAKDLYNQVTAKHGLAKITPITVVGEKVFSGFNGPKTTGKRIVSALEAAKYSDINTMEAHIERAPNQDVVTAGGCSEFSCDLGQADLEGFEFDLPFLGVVDLKSFSLFTLSVVLGVIDGFNPCAMWVLITFLVILSQAGSKKKMMLLAGIFIVAEGVMYNLILNVWYKTWDFVALDQYVTPAVGFLATGGGIFFLWRWHKNKSADLVCDITNVESQSRTINKLQQIVRQPITLMSIGAILLIAFSVNIIEFACSIGIPQAYTKILELNMLSFGERQWYILVYTIGYMVDDFIVFGLAIWGYSKLQTTGAKYAQLSLVIGGVLMLLLGILLITDPSLLVL